MKSDPASKVKSDTNRRLAVARGSALTEMDERILRSLTLRGLGGMRMCDILSHEEGVVVSRSLQRLKRRGLIEKVANKNRNLERWRVVDKAPNIGDQPRQQTEKETL